MPFAASDRFWAEGAAVRLEIGLSPAQWLPRRPLRSVLARFPFGRNHPDGKNESKINDLSLL